MGKHSLNSWKKQARHEVTDYVDDRIVIWGHDNDLPLIEKSYLYEGRITPTRMIKDKNVYEITYLHPIFIIHGVLIMTEQDLVKSITLFGYHPNRDPETNLYCLPGYKKGIKFDEQYFEMLLTNIKTYYLDDCFYTPAKNQVEYKKLRSISMQLNRGE